MRPEPLLLLLAAGPAFADPASSSSSAAAPVGEAHATPTTGIDRGKFYLGFGLALGASSLAEKAVAGAGSAALSFRTGAIIARRFLVGPEVVLTGQYNSWSAKEPTAAALSSVLLEGMAFPMSSVPLNVSLGLGWGSGLAVDRLPDNSSGDSRALATGSNGLAWMGGVGWDFFAGRGWNLGLQARYDGASLPDLKTAHGGSLALWLNSY